MNNEKSSNDKIVIEKGKFLTWLDNYWYHYKWVTLITAFFLIVVLICTLQVCTKKNNDIIVTYAGPISMKADEKIAVQMALEKALPEGFADKENATAGFVAYYVLSQNQIESLERHTDEEGYRISVDREFNTNELKSFDAQVGTGSGSVVFMEPWIYQREGMAERLTPLADVFGETPEGAIDEYAVRLGDTEFYQSNPQLSFLNPDTVVCLHAKIVGQKNYENEIEAFKIYAAIAPKTEEASAQ